MKITLWTYLILFVTIASCSSSHKNISPFFEINEIELKEIIKDQNPEIQNKILKNSSEFLRLIKLLVDQPDVLFQLADKNHTLLRNQGPSELVSPWDYGIKVSRKERQISKLAIEALLAMSDAAKAQGIEILFASGHRSYTYQENLYNYYVDKMGEAEASRISAKPGTSQHQLGTAMDFGSISDEYASTTEGKWLKANASTYGFSLSYPKGLEDVTGYKWECWHYRYIGLEAINLQKNFFLDVQQYLMEFLFLHKDEIESRRIIISQNEK